MLSFAFLMSAESDAIMARSDKRRGNETVKQTIVEKLEAPKFCGVCTEHFVEL